MGQESQAALYIRWALTDIASGWTECVAFPVHEQALIVEAINGLRLRLPFSDETGYGQRICIHERQAVGSLPGAGQNEPMNRNYADLFAIDSSPQTVPKSVPEMIAAN